MLLRAMFSAPNLSLYVNVCFKPNTQQVLCNVFNSNNNNIIQPDPVISIAEYSTCIYIYACNSIAKRNCFQLDYL